jgi:hypothetical protein
MAFVERLIEDPTISDPANGVVLCIPCHEILHQETGMVIDRQRNASGRFLPD